MRKLFCILLILLAFAPGKTLSAEVKFPISAPVDLNWGCQYQGFAKAVLIGTTAFDWRCQTLSGVNVDMSVEGICEFEYRQHAQAVYIFDDPYSWRCELTGLTNINIPPFSCDWRLPTRLAILTTGKVTQDQRSLPNNLRNHPGRQSGQKVGQIPAGGTFDIVGGPVCREQMIWYYVCAQALCGWTAEGEGGIYWLEPTAAAPTIIENPDTDTFVAMTRTEVYDTVKDSLAAAGLTDNEIRTFARELWQESDNCAFTTVDFEAMLHLSGEQSLRVFLGSQSSRLTNPCIEWLVQLYRDYLG